MKNLALKKLRTEKNWTQDKIASKLGISIPGYCKIESGTTDVNLSRLRELAAIHDLSLIELICIIDNVELPKSEVSELQDRLADYKYKVEELQGKLINAYEVANEVSRKRVNYKIEEIV